MEPSERAKLTKESQLLLVSIHEKAGEIRAFAKTVLKETNQDRKLYGLDAELVGIKQLATAIVVLLSEDLSEDARDDALGQALDIVSDTFGSDYFGVR